MITLFGSLQFFSFVSFLLYPMEVKRLRNAMLGAFTVHILFDYCLTVSSSYSESSCPKCPRAKHVRKRTLHYVCQTTQSQPLYGISNNYTMACPPVRGDNPRALASGLSYVQVDKHGIIILYHLHQCRPCTSSDISC